MGVRLCVGMCLRVGVVYAVLCVWFFTSIREFLIKFINSLGWLLVTRTCRFVIEGHLCGVTSYFTSLFCNIVQARVLVISACIFCNAVFSLGPALKRIVYNCTSHWKVHNASVWCSAPESRGSRCGGVQPLNREEHGVVVFIQPLNHGVVVFSVENERILVFKSPLNH